MISSLEKFFRNTLRDPITIHIYYAFRYSAKVFVRGRVLQDKIIRNNPEDRWYNVLLNLIRNLLSDEKKNTLVHISYGKERIECSTDLEGYFQSEFEDEQASMVEICSATSHLYKKEIYTIDYKAQYGIISDIDDTLLKTGVTSFLKWKVLMNTFFRNPWKRKSYTGMIGFIDKLKRGIANSNNPIFYISNSPWNLFSYLKDFLKSSGYQDGILILRDISASIFKRKAIEKKNKYKEIAQIFKECHGLPFVLIGDSGEIDTDIYLEISKQFPDRVLAIYIRDLPKSRRKKDITELIGSKADVPIRMFNHASQLEEHAAEIGLVESFNSDQES